MKALELLAFLIDTPFKGCFGLIREARDDCKREIGQSGVSGFILSSKYYLLDRMTSHPRVSGKCAKADFRELIKADFRE